MSEAFIALKEKGDVEAWPFADSVAAVSVGVIKGTPMLDLDYSEDSTAEVDMNIVMTGTGKLVEVQGTAEQGTFDRAALDAMLDLGSKGIVELVQLQQQALGAPEYE